MFDTGTAAGRIAGVRIRASLAALLAWASATGYVHGQTCFGGPGSVRRASPCTCLPVCNGADGQARLVVRRETLDDLLSHDIWQCKTQERRIG